MWGVDAPESAHFQGHLYVFCNTAGGSLQPGTSPVVKPLCSDSTMAKKYALFVLGT